MRHKLTKKALSLLVTLAMLLSMVPVAYAEGEESQEEIPTNVAEVTFVDTKKSYTDIKTAFVDANDAVENVTIKLLNDVILTEQIVASGSGITLDLNGNAINGYFGNDLLDPKFSAVIQNTGVLTITDSGENGKIDGGTTNTYAVYNDNAGTLTIESGSFIGGSVDSGVGFSVYYSAVQNAGATAIHGGTFTNCGSKDTTGNTSNHAVSGDGITVDGGTFSHNPSTYLAEGYVATANEDGTWTVKPAATDVAEVTIGETTTPYTDIKTAFNAANSAAESVTVKLLEDVTLDTDLQIGSGASTHTINVDLNGKSIDGATYQVFTAGSCEAINIYGGGTIKNNNSNAGSSGAALYIFPGTNVVLNDVSIIGNYEGIHNYGYLTILKADIDATKYGVGCFGSGSTVFGTENGDNSGIFVDATFQAIATAADLSLQESTVTVYGGTFTTTGSNWDENPVYWAGHGVLNVYGGTFTNNTTTQNSALYQKNGTVNIYGGTFESRNGIKVCAEQSDCTEITLNIYDGTFTGTNHAAFYFKTTAAGSNCGTYKINILGGNFSGTASKGAISKSCVNDVITPTVIVTGGTYSSNPSDYVPATHEAVKDEATSTWTVQPAVTNVAKIGDVEYATLQEAISASTGVDTTIELLSDITLDSTIMTTGWLTLDLAGHTIDGGSNQVFNCWYGIVRIKDTSAEQTGKITTTADTAISVHGDLSHDNTVEIQGGTIHSSGNAVYVNSYATAKISGGVLDGTAFASGRSAKSVAKIDITGGTINGGIWAQYYSNVTVSGDDTLIKGGMTIFGEEYYEGHHSTALVSGGQFQWAPSSYLAPGKEAVWNGFYYVVRTKADPVAQIGDTKYTSLQAAIDAATGEANTIELLADVTGASTITINKNLTLDLNGKSIRCSGTGNWDYTVNVKDGTVIIKNSGGTPSTIEQTVGNRALWISGGKVTLGSGVTVTSRGYAMCVCDTGKFILKGGTVHSDEEYGIYEMMYSADKAPEVIIESGTVEAPATTGNGIGIVITGNDSSTYAPILTVNGGTVSGGDSAISGKGDTGNTVINITGGTVKGGIIGIYHPQAGTLTLKGGEITGGTGIYAKSGTVTVPADSAVKVQGTGERAEYKYQTSGCVSTGDALVLERCGYPGGLVSAAIAGGTFTSTEASAVAAYTQDEEKYPALTKFLTGGTYSSKPDVAYIATGYEAVDNQNGTWTVRKAMEAQIFGADGNAVSEPYAYLKDAISEATAGQTVKLLTDVTQDDGVIIDKNLTIDLNDKTFTVNKGSNTSNRNIKVTGKVDVTIKNGSMVAAGSGTTKDNGAGCYGTVRFESSGKLTLTDLTLTNSRPWGLNVKVTNGKAELNNVTINSSYGGGIEVAGAIAVLNNCTVTQTGYFDHCSTCVSVSSEETFGSSVIVNGGTYTSNDGYGAYVFNSGGTITINGGTFRTGKAVLKADKSIEDDLSVINVSGGDFTGEIAIADGATLTLTGGTYDRDVNAYCAPGYEAVKVTINSSDMYEVREKPLADVKPDTPVVVVPPASSEVTEEVKDVSNDLSDKLSNSTDTIVSGVGLNTATEQAKIEAKNDSATNTETAKGTLTGAGVRVDDTVNIVVQNYTKVEVTGVEKEPDVQDAKLKSVTLNITPLVRTVATTASGDTKIKVKGDTGVEENDANAVVVIEPKKLAITGEVEVTVPVPDNFAVTGDGETVWVLHKTGDGKRYVYEGTVDANKNVTFKNPHGFSEFTLLSSKSLVDEAAIVNGSTGSLTAMLAEAATNGGTVQLLKEVTASGLTYVPANVTLDLNGNVLSATDVVSFGTLKDSEDGVGLLKITGNKYVEDTNGQAVLYNATEEGYQFFNFEFTQHPSSPYAVSNTAVKFYDLMTFTNSSAYTLLQAADNGKVQVFYDLSWGDLPEDRVENIMMPANAIQGYAANVGAGAALYLKVSGLNVIAGKDLTATIRLEITDFSGLEIQGAGTTYKVPTAT